MENLPVEILISIFLRLHTLQKMECMRACRHWNEVIKSHCLLETDVIRSESDSLRWFHSLMAHIKDNHFSGLCTRRLFLCELERLDVGIVELSTLFPNLRSLTFTNSNLRMDMPSTNAEILSTFAKWLSQLEYICEYIYTLSIPFKSWIHHLNNVPALKILKLTNFCIELGDIEVLHTNAPLITTLELAGIEFLATGNLDSRLSKPPMVETLSIKNCLSLFLAQERWVLYFLRSYVHLRDITFECYPMTNKNLPERLALTIIMALGDYIQSFRTDLKTQGYHELEELNRKNIRLNNLQFALGGFRDVRFNDEELIRRCDMFKHLHTLVIYDFDPEIFEITKEFTNLRQLALRFPYSRYMTKISLDILLIRQCPVRLESLCIENALVTALPDDSQVLPNFKTLKVKYGCLDDGVIEFLSQQCPRLLELVFYSTRFAPTCIDLPSHNLNLLDIGYLCSKPFIKVNLDGDVRLYDNFFTECYPREDDAILFSSVKPLQSRNLSNNNVLDVVCRSIRTIIINGCVVV